MKTIILIGAGMRGRGYTNIMKDSFPEGTFKVVAVAEPVENFRNYVKDKHGIDPENCKESWEELLARPKFADAVVICTLDRDHFEPTVAAINAGYDVLLEKPIGAEPDECLKLGKIAKEKGTRLTLCFVLRHTTHYRAVKKILKEGMIGDVVNIQHVEGVGNVHQSHSFVRGNWHNENEASCMLLQKSSHDIDIMEWLIEKKCKKVQSFGGIKYFCKKNAPEGSPEYCIDGCPVGSTCPYNAVKLYLDDKDNDWFRSVATKMTNATDADVEKAIRTTNYGKCVFKCDNNVVDHQVVNLEYEDGITASFTMSAFNEGGRVMRIMGTKGELFADFGKPHITVYTFEDKEKRDIDVEAKALDQNITGGHGGGDDGVIHRFLGILNGNEDLIEDFDEVITNHMVVFAAEKSRRENIVVDMDEFMAEINSKI